MVLRYCQDDIDKARNKIEELRQISILNDILNYCDSLSDKKIDKIIKMKRIVRESDK